MTQRGGPPDKPAPFVASELARLHKKIAVLELERAELMAARAQSEAARSDSQDLYDIGPLPALSLDRTQTIRRLNHAVKSQPQGEVHFLTAGATDVAEIQNLLPAEPRLQEGGDFRLRLRVVSRNEHCVDPWDDRRIDHDVGAHRVQRLDDVCSRKSTLDLFTQGISVADTERRRHPF